MAVRVSFKLTVQETYQGLIVAAGPDYVTTDALTGLGVINLFPNALGANGSQYTVKAVDVATGRKVLESLCTVPDSPCYLDLILNQEPFPTIDAAGVALAATQGALALVTAKADIATTGASTATDAAAGAVISATSALTHSQEAATHRQYAWLARDEAAGFAASSEADKTQTALDRAATGADSAQTALDAIVTAADRVQTGGRSQGASAAAPLREVSAITPQSSGLFVVRPDAGGPR
jgi:hypothetical protein